MSHCLHSPEQLSVLFRARDFVSGDRFDVCECAACGVVLTSPRPGPRELAGYYPAHYHRDTQRRRFPAPVELLQRALYRHRARAVETLSGGRPGRVLDVGCGPGFQLAAFQRRRWEVHGVELTEESATHAREVLGLPVHVGDAASWPWPERTFDAIVAWHSLEHFPDPQEMLEVFARFVRPGGVVMVGVPNFGSPEARLSRDGWFHLDVPRHLYHFTPGSLERALESARFQVRRSSFFAPEYDVFSFVQSVENRLGLEHNRLYELLRSGSGERTNRLQSLLALVLAIPLGLAALPFTALLAPLGLGSSVTLFAVKR